MSTSSDVVSELRKYEAHEKRVNCVALGQKSAQIMITGGDDMLIKFWSLDRQKPLMMLSGHSNSVEGVAFNKSELKIASGCAAGVLKVWDLETEKLMRSLSGHKSSIHSIDFHPVGEFTASGAADYTVKLWDLNRKGCINTYKGHEGKVCKVQFSPDGKWLVSADACGKIKLWDLIAGKLFCDFNKHTDAITGVEFHPSDFILATGSLDRTVKFWDLEKNELFAECVNEDDVVSAIKFHPEGPCLYWAGEERVGVCEWELQKTFQSVQLPSKIKTSALSVCNDVLIGAQLSNGQVSVFTVDIQRLPPFCKASGDSASADKKLGSSGRKTFVAGSASDPAQKYNRELADKDENGTGDGKFKVEDPEYCKQIINNAKENQNKNQNDKSKPNSKNHKPALVAVEDFMKNPAGAYDENSGQSSSDPAESEVLQRMKSGHSAIVSVLTSRHRSLRVVSNEWDSNIKKSIELAVSLREQSIVIDLLDVLLHRPSLWNLDICVILLPVLNDLVNSKHDYYVSISLSTLRHIIKSFGSLIKSCILVPPPAMQVDISREERYKRCLKCYEILTRIRGDLDQKLYKYPGRLGDKLREIHGLIVQMK